MVWNRKNGLFSGIVSLRSDKDTKNTGAPMGINTHICPERCGKPGVLRAAFTPTHEPEPAGTACRPPQPGASACPLRRSSFCWRFYSYSASRPSPRAALPLGAEAGDPTDRNSRRIWLRPYGSGGRRHPPRRDVQRLLLAASTPNRLRTEKIPATGARSGQPPPIGWLRHSTVLVSPRRAADPHPLDVLLAASTLRLVRVGRPTPPRCGGDAQRLLRAVYTFLFGLAVLCDLRSLGPAAAHRLAPTLGGARVFAPDG